MPEGEMSSRVVVRLLEGVVAEGPVIAMLMMYLHTVLGGKGLEGVFGC